MADDSELGPGEFHPAWDSAVRWLAEQQYADLTIWLESLNSVAMSGNRLAEVCAGTLDRVIHGKPVGERYLLGLVWVLRTKEWEN